MFFRQVIKSYDKNHMRLFISGDVDWESRIDKIILKFPTADFRDFLQQRKYGEGLKGVSVIFMCQDESLALKRRIKLSKAESNIHLDIMLSFSAMKAATDSERMHEVAQRLWDEVPDVLSRYKIADFDKDAFIADWRKWIDGIGWK